MGNVLQTLKSLHLSVIIKFDQAFFMAGVDIEMIADYLYLYFNSVILYLVDMLSSSSSIRPYIVLVFGPSLQAHQRTEISVFA